MSKEVIEAKLAELMDTVPECEGLIAADMEGNVIVGQTIIDMDHGKIAETCLNIVKNSNNLSANIDKGTNKNTTIELENGFVILVSSEKLLLIALTGMDGKTSLGLIKRNLKSILKL
ncbi:MAG: roadblock/LC7 domain-containing protein [Promethearchaeota archaeon]